MGTTETGYPIISADSHVTEPADLWSSHIEPEFRDRAPHVETREETDVFVCDGVDLFPVGIVHAVRYKGADVRPNGRYEDVPASGWDPVARVADIERDGVAMEVLYPTIAMRLFAIDDLPFAQACIRAYNTWLAEFCAQAPDRFKGVGMLHLDDLDIALGEMERCREIGLAGVMVASSQDESRPYELDYYLPFWARAEALGLPVSMHAATPRRVHHEHFDSPSAADAFLHYTAVQRSLIGLIYAGVFDKFPDLHLVSAENDAGWAGNIIERMDYVDVKGRFRNMYRDHLNREAPSYYWHRNIHYTMMRDRAGVLSRELIGTGRMMWSSDFPHGDSSWPESLKVIDETLDGCSAEERWRLLCGNAAELYGFSVAGGTQ